VARAFSKSIIIVIYVGGGGCQTTGTRQQKPLHMAWEWELRDTCQTSVRYAALGDSIIARLTIQLKIT